MRLTVGEWLAIVSFLTGILIGAFKFYALFAKMQATLSLLSETIKTLSIQNGDHEKRITILETKERSNR